MVVSLALDHRRKPTVSRADPPVIPVTDEISPNENLQFLCGHSFRIVAVIEKLAFHSGPHAFASGIIVTPATSTVHALNNTVFCQSLTIGFTGIFNIDTASPSAELLKDEEEQQTLDELLDMVDNGLINEAENKIYEITEEGSKIDLEIALLFYSYLNDKSDDFLEAYNFSRDEIKSGLKDITVRYGIDGFAEMFL